MRKGVGGYLQGAERCTLDDYLADANNLLDS